MNSLLSYDSHAPSRASDLTLAKVFHGFVVPGELERRVGLVLQKKGSSAPHGFTDFFERCALPRFSSPVREESQVYQVQRTSKVRWSGLTSHFPVGGFFFYERFNPAAGTLFLGVFWSWKFRRKLIPYLLRVKPPKTPDSRQLRGCQVSPAAWNLCDKAGPRVG